MVVAINFSFFFLNLCSFMWDKSLRPTHPTHFTSSTFPVDKELENKL